MQRCIGISTHMMVMCASVNTARQVSCILDLHARFDWYSIKYDARVCMGECGVRGYKRIRISRLKVH